MRHQLLFWTIVGILTFGLFSVVGLTAAPARCTVTTAADSGAGSLRTCLEKATVGTTIDFSPATFPPTSPVTITLAITLPVIITDHVTIDGSDAWVVLDGSRLPDRDGNSGLRIQGADGVIIQGLQVINFPRGGIALEHGASNSTIGGDRAIGKGPLGQGNLISRNAFHGIMLADDTTHGNHIEGNNIGTGIHGAVALGNGEAGIVLGWCTHDNVIGGTTPTTRNLISGNGAQGIHIRDACTAHNRIIGNFIGTDASGTRALSNQFGVAIWSARNNQIGGKLPGEGNLISGNRQSGIVLQNDAVQNQIAGNLIGADASGMYAVGNGEIGILLSSGASHNLIGGVNTGERNLISGNHGGGVMLQQNAAANQIVGNYIGTDITGQHALNTAPRGTPLTTPGGRNGQDGVALLTCAHDNIIGGATSSARNILSGNPRAGIFLQDTCTGRNQVMGNYIGVATDGVHPVSNQFGVVIWSAQHNQIGGAASGTGNLISGNQNSGISLQNAAAYNQIAGNRIGTDMQGKLAVSNGEAGILLSAGAANNLIGGAHAGERNLISGNPKAGIQMQGPDTQGNQVFGNYIGVEAKGVGALCERNGTPACVQSAGIRIRGGAQHNFIGGVHVGEGNLVSGNGLHGIAILDQGSVGNQIQGNIIGPDASGTQRLPHGQETGIYLNAVHDTLIGGPSPSARNLISGHKMHGVWIDDINSNGNRVQGNYIGVDISGSQVLSNNVGITILGQDNLIGGPGAGNLISGNTGWGITIGGEPVFTEQHSTRNQVQGNLIGTDVTGRHPLGNGIGINLAWGALNNQIGGSTPAQRNVISGNREMGITIIGGDERVLAEANGNLIQGNFIGTDNTGQYALGNRFGISIGGRASGNIIGGLAAREGNVISGNRGIGVGLLRLAVHNSLVGNLIGVSAAGLHPVPNGDAGVTLLNGASGNTIGISNTIAYNLKSGIAIFGTHTLANSVRQNAIFQNDQAQITISPTLILSPTLLAYAPISHTVSGTACPRCQVEIFANPANQAGSVHYLGATQADRQGRFVLTLAVAPPERFLTATATERGTTSPFSAPLVITQ